MFPVPDGDTGTNMWLTMRHAYNEIAHIEEPHVGRLSRAIAEGALRGARGNSGVILSQLWAGVADALDGHETLDAELLAYASRSAVDKAYRAVETPVEGTILTVSRDMMEVDHRALRDHARPDRPAAPDADGGAHLAAPHARPAARAQKSGRRRFGRSGAGADLRGDAARALRAQRRSRKRQRTLTASRRPTWQDALEPEDEAGYGYDVQFLMRGDNLSVDAVKKALAEMGGWSTLVVGDPRLIKVHVHLHDPGQALSYAIGTRREHRRRGGRKHAGAVRALRAGTHAPRNRPSAPTSRARR